MESELSDTHVSERVIPSDHLQLMFHYREPFRVRYPDDRESMQPRALISGLTDSFSDVTTRNETGVIFVSFFPAGACQFINLPLSELENLSIDLNEVQGKEVARVEELLCLKRTVPEKVRVIEDFLTGRFSPAPRHDHRLVSGAVDLIRQYRGKLSATILADKLACTTKSLERKFAAYIGKTPKQYIKLVRFQEILTDFSRNKGINLSEYAYRNGYFDQAHFTHDFKQYTGYTPGEFISRYPCYDIDADTV